MTILVDLRGGHQHAVHRGRSEVVSWTSQVAEVSDLDRAAVGLLGAVFSLARTGKRKGQGDDDRRE
jgi:hypothetical protein